MIICCEECLVRSICVNASNRIAVTCNYLYYDIIENKGNSDIEEKLIKIEEIFNIPRMIIGNGGFLFMIYPDKNRRQVILRGYDGYDGKNMLIDITNPYEPNIEGLKKTAKFRWFKVFGGNEERYIAKWEKLVVLSKLVDNSPKTVKKSKESKESKEIVSKDS